MDLKSKIERILSDILSQKHEAKITLRFERRTPNENHGKAGHAQGNEFPQR